MRQVITLQFVDLMFHITIIICLKANVLYVFDLQICQLIFKTDFYQTPLLQLISVYFVISINRNLSVMPIPLLLGKD